MINLAVALQGHGRPLGCAIPVNTSTINQKILGNMSNSETCRVSSKFTICPSCCRMIPEGNMALHTVYCKVSVNPNPNKKSRNNYDGIQTIIIFFFFPVLSLSQELKAPEEYTLVLSSSSSSSKETPSEVHLYLAPPDTDKYYCETSRMSTVSSSIIGNSSSSSSSISCKARAIRASRVLELRNQILRCRALDITIH